LQKPGGVFLTGLFSFTFQEHQMNNGFSFLDIEAFANRFYQGRRLLITPYAYPIRFEGLAPNVPTTLTVNIAANADFIMLSAAARASVADPDDPVTVSSLLAPTVRALFTDSGSGENFTNGTIDLQNYVQLGYVYSLPYPRFLTGRTVVSTQVNNYGAETYDHLEIALIGVQVRALEGN
jgi:hypothetical protein